MNRSRITTLPPFLPARDYAPIDHKAQSAHPTEIPGAEVIGQWYKMGAIPVSMMLFDRLIEILAPIDTHYHEVDELRKTVEDYRAILHCPTRNPTRVKVHYPGE